ncbi:MAG: hypothetical protein AB203_04115 [Parcubacteria bacterium C7867-008]|nr:MAG: hypothetical protein AB203_04115 [Parcubacteria bacterium C7867-008]
MAKLLMGLGTLQLHGLQTTLYRWLQANSMMNRDISPPLQAYCNCTLGTNFEPERVRSLRDALATEFVDVFQEEGLVARADAPFCVKTQQQDGYTTLLLPLESKLLQSVRKRLREYLSREWGFRVHDGDHPASITLVHNIPATADEQIMELCAMLVWPDFVTFTSAAIYTGGKQYKRFGQIPFKTQ